jgi:hypothetical protein
MRKMKEKDTQDTLPTNVGRYPISDLRVQARSESSGRAGQEHRDDTYGSSKGTAARSICDRSGIRVELYYVLPVYGTVDLERGGSRSQT